MTISIHLRPALAGGALSLVLALAPGTAEAAKKVTVAAPNGGAPEVYVCNEAGAAFLGGELHVLDVKADPDPPARFKHELKPLPGKGVGLVTAAEQSPARALCGAPVEQPPAGGGDGGDGTIGGDGGGDTGGGGLNGDNT